MSIGRSWKNKHNKFVRRNKKKKKTAKSSIDFNGKKTALSNCVKINNDDVFSSFRFLLFVY